MLFSGIVMEKRCITDWDFLCAYFFRAEFDSDQSAKFKAQVIEKMLADNKLFIFHFPRTNHCKF